MGGRLEGIEMWICLPLEARIGRKWDKFNKPGSRRVVRLRLALYGHPGSGTCWERHCGRHQRSVGFELVSEIWPSCYMHKEHGLFLVVYVDDFKLAGPKDKIALGWSLPS